MRKKRSVSWLVSVVFMMTIFFGSSLIAFAAGPTDVQGHWAKGTINQMVEEGVIAGYPDGTFKPDNSITRAEFATIIVKAFKLGAKSGKVFADIEEHWAKANISTANANGIVNGYSDKKFGPDDPITREQMAVMAVMAAKLTGSVDSKTFTDSQNISDWAKSSVALAVGNDIITGYPDNTFKPKGNATRAEATIVISGTLDVKGVIEENYSLIDEAGTYGPATGTETVSGDVTIKASDAILQNLVIKGDLVIAKEVGDGDVTLNNVKVEGKTYIRGGGKDSIHINGGIYNEVIIEKTVTGLLRIVAVNSQGLQIIIAENAADDEIILSGEFDKVTVNADDVNIITQEGAEIGELKVQSGLKNVNIELAQGSSVEEMVLNSKVNVEGEGTTNKASGTNASNSTFTNPPGVVSSPRTGGGGGATTIAVSAISVNKKATTLAVAATETLVATVLPENATDKTVTWTSSDADIATVDDGVVTAVGVGTATITAKAGNYIATCVVTVGLPATWKDTGKVGTNTINKTAYVFQGFELLDGDSRIDLVASNIEKMTVLDPEATEVKELTVGGDTDPLMWFNVRKATGEYKYTVVTKGEEPKTYVAKLSWTAPAEVDATKTGKPVENTDRNAFYQLYTVQVDVTPKDSKVYQIKPDGEIHELAILTDNDNHLNIWFKVKDTENETWKQLEGNHTFLIKKGDAWSEAVINYSVPELTVTGPEAKVAAGAANFAVTFDVTHDKGLEYLEIDHNLGKHGSLPSEVDTLPEFKLYPNAENVWSPAGMDETDADARKAEAEGWGLNATYSTDGDAITWVLTFGGKALVDIRALTEEHTNNKFKIYSIVKDVDGIQSGSMYDSSYETTVVVLETEEEAADAKATAKATAKAAIKPSWEINPVVRVEEGLPAGIEGNVDYEVTIKTSYEDKEAAQASGRNVTTFFTIPEKVTVYYPVWEEGRLKYKSATNEEVVYGMVGHPLSEDNIDVDGVVYVAIDEDVIEIEFEFTIKLVDADAEWNDVVYREKQFVLTIAAISDVKDLGETDVSFGENVVYIIQDNTTLAVWTFAIAKDRLPDNLKDATTYQLWIGDTCFSLEKNEFDPDLFNVDLPSDDYSKEDIEGGKLRGLLY